jgi:hypothetical protein
MEGCLVQFGSSQRLLMTSSISAVACWEQCVGFFHSKPKEGFVVQFGSSHSFGMFVKVS